VSRTVVRTYRTATERLRLKIDLNSCNFRATFQSITISINFRPKVGPTRTMYCSFKDYPTYGRSKESSHIRESLLNNNCVPPQASTARRSSAPIRQRKVGLELGVRIHCIRRISTSRAHHPAGPRIDSVALYTYIHTSHRCRNRAASVVSIETSRSFCPNLNKLPFNRAGNLLRLPPSRCPALSKVYIGQRVES